MTVREALNTSIKEEMERDKSVVVIGEEVAEYQGAYKITQGLHEKFSSSRVMDTPITEMGFTGISVGAAMNGMRPICEFMSFNFSLQSIDQILNSAAKACYMSGGKIKVPVVFRGPNGAAKGVGAQHSQDFSSWFSSVPGLKVFSIFDSDDARGMVKSAVRDDNPVILLENELMYGDAFEVEDKALKKDYLVPFGKAKLMREGSDVTIVASSISVKKSLEAAMVMEKEGISAEVINLRCLRPLDTAAIFQSVKKTNRIVVVEEGWPQCGIGAEICGLFMDTKNFYHLDAPVERVTGADVPMPYAKGLEDFCTPSPSDIVSACKRALHRVSK